jgi:hypothetical protein
MVLISSRKGRVLIEQLTTGWDEGLIGPATNGGWGEGGDGVAVLEARVTAKWPFGAPRMASGPRREGAGHFRLRWGRLSVAGDDGTAGLQVVGDGLNRLPGRRH